MIKMLWLASFIAAIIAVCLHPLGDKHYVITITVIVLAILALGGYIALIILLFGGPFYL